MTELSNTCAHGKPMLGTFAVCPVCRPDIKETNLFFTGVFRLCREVAVELKVHWRDVDDAASVAQLVVFQGQEKAMAAKNPGAWVHQVARNAICKWLRDREDFVPVSPVPEKKERESKLEWLTANPPKPDGQSKQQRRKAEERRHIAEDVRVPKYARLSKQKRRFRGIRTEKNSEQIDQSLREALKGLSSQDRVILYCRLELYRYPYKTWEVLSEDLGLSVPQVRHRFRKALGQVKDRLSKVPDVNFEEALFPAQSIG